jgi:hypothetical protein
MPVSPASERVTSILAPLAESLAADGYVLHAQMDATGLQLVVDATEDACVDCLVPADLFRNIVATTMKKGGMPMPEQRIRITYPEGRIH